MDFSIFSTKVCEKNLSECIWFGSRQPDAVVSPQALEILPYNHINTMYRSDMVGI